MRHVKQFCLGRTKRQRQAVILVVVDGRYTHPLRRSHGFFYPKALHDLHCRNIQRPVQRLAHRHVAIKITHRVLRLIPVKISRRIFQNRRRRNHTFSHRLSIIKWLKTTTRLAICRHNIYFSEFFVIPIITSHKRPDCTRIWLNRHSACVCTSVSAHHTHICVDTFLQLALHTKVERRFYLKARTSRFFLAVTIVQICHGHFHKMRRRAVICQRFWRSVRQFLRERLIFFGLRNKFVAHHALKHGLLALFGKFQITIHRRIIIWRRQHANNHRAFGQG